MLLSRLDQTGMTTHTIELAEALVRKGHNVTILTGWNKIPDTVALSLMDRLNNTGAKIKTFFAPDKSSKLKRALSAISLLINVLMCKGGGNTRSIALSVLGSLAVRSQIYFHITCR